MYDNGLISYYRNLQSKNGYLDLNGNEDFKLGRKVKCHSLVAKMQTPEGLFFIKESDPVKTDAEVLLSQIYKSCGFDTAIYTPAILGNKHVISNNVINKNNILAYDFFKKHDISLTKTPLHYFIQKSESNSTFSENVIKELIELRVFDYASFNFDRHKLNFCFNEQNKQAQNVVLFDYGASAIGYLNYDVDNMPFYNDFSITPMDRNEFLEILKSISPKIDSINLDDIAHEIGSVDIEGHVKDIKESIGYSVDNNYAYALSKSFDNMANELVQN